MEFLFVTPYMEHGTFRGWRQEVNPSALEIRDRVSLISVSEFRRLTLTCFSQMLEVARAIRCIHSLGLVLGWLGGASGVWVHTAGN
jgi:hypothetical protein